MMTSPGFKAHFQRARLAHRGFTRGFTLPEILVIIAVIGLLGALLFPILGRAREISRQGHCAGNLQNVYLATRQYREDFQGYPPTLETLLPAGAVVVVSSGAGQTQGAPPAPRTSVTSDAEPVDPLTESGLATVDGTASPTSITEEIEVVTYVPKSLDYLKSLSEVVCPSDKLELNGFSSSYGSKIGSVWNFYGYNRLGFQSQTEPSPELLVNPDKPFNASRNPAKFSLANRFAPPGTIVSHCIFHRSASSDLQNPYALSTDSDQGRGAGASDIVLRLDGSAKRRDVSGFKGTQGQPSANQSNNSFWQIQTF